VPLGREGGQNKATNREAMGVGEKAAYTKVTPTATLAPTLLDEDRRGRARSRAGRIAPRQAPHNTRRVMNGPTNSYTAVRPGSAGWRCKMRGEQRYIKDAHGREKGDVAS
jgi:hypothetical protein